jgi:hypothetical protein
MIVSLMPLAAQFETATVLGTIQDPSGGVIPGATVRLENVDTRVGVSTQTNEYRDYQYFSVRIGRYVVTAQAPGFKAAKSGEFTVTVTARQRVDLRLEMGTVSEVVEVTGAAALVETDHSSRGTVIRASEATGLPLNGRSYADLALLTPGVTQAQVGQVSGRNASYHVNGLRSSFNNFTLDGVDNNAYGTSNQGFSNQVVQLSPDAVGEFRVTTNTYSAEYGRAGGAIIIASTRSGANRFSVSAWEFLRNTDRTPRAFSSPPPGRSRT